MSGAGLDEIYRLMDQLDLQNEMEHTIEGIGRAYGEVSLDDLLGVQAPRFNATEMLNKEIKKMEDRLEEATDIVDDAPSSESEPDEIGIADINMDIVEAEIDVEELPKKIEMAKEEKKRLLLRQKRRQSRDK